jgi:cell filamentation protein
MMASFENWGDYFWPDQIDDCRRNKLDIHDAQQLEKVERNRTARRATELVTGRAKIEQTFDLDHLRGIHRHLFQDVYEWAGQLRATELVRPANDPDQPGHEFAKPEQIQSMAGMLFSNADPKTLAGRPRDGQVEQLAKTYAGLNVLHPFVEGNGRTQRIFTGDLASSVGLAVDWGKMPQQNEVMAEAFTVGFGPVLDALRPCIVDRDQAGPAAFTAARLSAIGAAPARGAHPLAPGTGLGTGRPSQRPDRSPGGRADGRT